MTYKADITVLDLGRTCCKTETSDWQKLRDEWGDNSLQLLCHALKS